MSKAADDVVRILEAVRGGGPALCASQEDNSGHAFVPAGEKNEQAFCTRCGKVIVPEAP